MARAANIDERILKLQAELDAAMKAKADTEKKRIASENEAIIKVIRQHIAKQFEGFNAQEFIATIGNITGTHVQVPVVEVSLVKPESINRQTIGSFDEF